MKKRCVICDWPLREDGCHEGGDCCYRPENGPDAQKVRDRRAALNRMTRAVAHVLSGENLSRPDKLAEAALHAYLNPTNE
jgi:hypothetical protein